MPLVNAYMLEASAEGCFAEVRLNDIPIALVGADHPRLVTVPVNEQVLNGQNRVSLIVHPSSPPDHWRDPHTLRPPAKAFAQAALVRYPPGAYAGDPEGTSLASAKWNAREDGRDEPFPQTAQGVGTAASSIWSWESATRLTLDRSLRDAVFDQLSELHQALSSGNVDKYLELIRPRTGEICIAYAIDFAEREGIFRRVLNDMVTQKTNQLQPLLVEHFALRLVADDRMVQCIAQDWLPILRTMPTDDGSSSLPIFLASIGGKLRVIR